MGHDGMTSGYPTPTGFRRLTGCQWDPQDRGVTPSKPKPCELKGSKMGWLGKAKATGLVCPRIKTFFFILIYPSNLKFNTHTKLYLYLTYIINF